MFEEEYNIRKYYNSRLEEYFIENPEMKDQNPILCLEDYDQNYRRLFLESLGSEVRFLRQLRGRSIVIQRDWIRFFERRYDHIFEEEFSEVEKIEMLIDFIENYRYEYELLTE